MTFIKRYLLIFSLALLFAGTAFATDAFVIRKIQFEGLQRIRVGTALSYLPVKEGETFDPRMSGEIISRLYKTGFFSDVRLAKKGQALIITVVERPIIGELRISGNKNLSTKQLLGVLKAMKISEGRVYSHSVISELKQATLQQYHNLGRYNARVNVRVSKKPRNRVALHLDISEGPIAKIKRIKIIGNKAFSKRTLLRQLSLASASLWTTFSYNDRYSKEKLDADIETLRSYYLDRGYLSFKIDSTQVSITPDKKHVYIVFHITEGPVYRIKAIRLYGHFPGGKKKIQDMIAVKPGELFSRNKVIAVNSQIGEYLANLGYAYPDIGTTSSVDKVTKQVTLNFNVKPGKRIYVRRISFSGNNKTADYVLRREMRQLEGGAFSLANLNESKRRLSTLGYLKDVQMKTTHVPNRKNEVDVNYHVKEVSSAGANASVGYADTQGLIFGIGVTEKNFLGTGKAVSVAFSNSSYNEIYSFSITDPYYTMSGISRSISVFRRRTSPDRVGITSYSTNNYGLSMSYGIPVSEYASVYLGFGYEHTEIKTNRKTSTEVLDFIKNRGGKHFNEFKLNGSWSYSNLNKVVFPTKGLTQGVSAEISLPIGSSSLDYYKLIYNGVGYFPLYKEEYLLDLRWDVGFGHGYGRHSRLPFFKNFFAGGISSVRGFRGNTLGPRDSTNEPIGGNLLLDGSVGMVFPNPLGESFRTTAFIDAGNAYQRTYKFRALRYSVGINLEWYSPMGPIVLAFAVPLNANSKRGDEREFPQFSIGTSI